jgi:hypothetical protein
MGHDFYAHGANISFWNGTNVHPLDSQAAGFNFASLMTARVVLGIFEAGFAPVITLYFCEQYL